MKPKIIEQPSNRDMFRPLLVDIINPHHELVLLERVVDWQYFEREWSAFFTSTTGRPATSPRLIAGLFYLQHLYGHSDEMVLRMFLQSPYYQHFCGRIYFEHQLPIDPSSLVRWRKRVGEVGMEEMLLKSIEAAVQVDMVKTQSFSEVIVDTTVMEKAITHPTDSNWTLCACQAIRPHEKKS